MSTPVEPIVVGTVRYVANDPEPGAVSLYDVASGQRMATTVVFQVWNAFPGKSGSGPESDDSSIRDMQRSRNALVITTRRNQVFELNTSSGDVRKVSPDLLSGNGDVLLDLPAASPSRFQEARRGLESYRRSHSYAGVSKVAEDELNGLISTDWFPVHKGEIKVMVQVRVWGSNFRVDAWQKGGTLLGTKISQGREAQRAALEVHTAIAEVVESARKEPVGRGTR